MPVYATNKKARFEYEIIDKLEAGLVLAGNEVKSVRRGGARLTGAFVTFHGSSALLTNAHIGQYRFAKPDPAYDPARSRRLLLRQKEIDYLRGKAHEQGLTIVPLTIYTKGRLIKLQIALARGKKRYDKREAIKRRETKRELERKRKQWG